MSFSDFINTFVYGINLFLDNFRNFLDLAISNYFFLVLLGLTIFVSFVWFCYYLFTDILHVHIFKNIDNEIDMYDNFDKFQRMKEKWYDNNMEYVYRVRSTNYQVGKNIKEMYNDKNLPSWFFKEMDKNERLATEDEKKEMEMLLKNF